VARRRKGRHARVGGVPGSLAAVAASRRAWIALGGAAGLGLVATAAYLVPGDRRPSKVVVTAVPALRRPEPPALTPAKPAKGSGDEAALAYYQVKDQADAAHVSKILWTGPMLRVYTDLPGSDGDSKTAIALCETAAAYLEGRGQTPVVFVHAGRVAGYPVLANKMDAQDDCRLNRVP
jgi:hypothetical protein